MYNIHISSKVRVFLAGFFSLFFVTANVFAGEPQTCGYDQFKHSSDGYPSILDNLYISRSNPGTTPTIFYNFNSVNGCYLNADQVVKLRIVDITKSSSPREISNSEVTTLISELNSNFSGSVRFSLDSVDHQQVTESDYATATALNQQRKFFARYYRTVEDLPLLTVFVIDQIKSDAIDVCSNIDVVPDEEFVSGGPIDLVRMGFVTISKDGRCRNSRGTLASTLSHQLGHIFGLADTYKEFTGNQFVTNEHKEFVDREKRFPTDCSSQSDLLCDTPADPGLYDKSNQIHYISKDGQGACSYNQSIYENLHNGAALTDPDGVEYEPNVSNIMSETLPTCMKAFSPQQLQVMKQAASGIICAKDQPPLPGYGIIPSISVYPNPVTDRNLHIVIKELPLHSIRTFDVLIFDMNGRLVQKTQVSSDGLVVTLPMNVQKGMYIVKVKNDDVNNSYKIIVQ